MGVRALAGTATCIGTAAILRRRAGIVASTLGGVLVGNLTFGGVFARRVEPFFEKICAQPEHSPRVDSIVPHLPRPEGYDGGGTAGKGRPGP